MSPLDLIRGNDGKMVLTKLQAATFHLLLAVTVASITVVRLYKYATGVLPLTSENYLFDMTMWGLYAAVAVGHAVIDKTGAQVVAFKTRQLDAEAPLPDTRVTETKVTETGPKP